MEKQVLSIKVSAYFYNRLKSEVGKGHISAFIEKVVSKELGEQGRELEKEYLEAYDNPRLVREAKKWEKAEIESWRNYERKRKEAKK